MKADLKKYMELFETESRQHIETLNNSLVELEKKPNDADLLYNLMRAAHTLKGMCGTMGFPKITELCHKLENYFDDARNGKRSISKEDSDLLFKSLDALENSLKKAIETQEDTDVSETIEKLDSGNIKEPETQEASAVKDIAQPEINENITADAKQAQEVEDIKESETQELEGSEKVKSVNVSVKRLDKLMNLMEELIILKMRFSEIEKTKNYENFSYEIANFERLAEELQYNITQSRLVSADFLFNRYPRMIRDLSSSSDKQIELEINGGDLELDRTVIDQLNEPLVHLLRNAVDHGIEKEGKIKLFAYRDKGFAIIQIQDNGKGIDPEAVKAAAISKGILTQIQANELSKDEAINLIFHPKLSTKTKVTEVSGRGVGMSAVKKKLEELNGTIRIETKIGEGTTFILMLPLTLAIIKALFVKSANHTYAIPLTYIDQSVDIPKENIKKALGKEVALLHGEDIPLIDLKKIFNIGDETESENKVCATVIVKKANERVGLIVDEILDQEEVVVKPLNSMLKGRSEFAGITVLGDGKPVLILDIPNLF